MGVYDIAEQGNYALSTGTVQRVERIGWAGELYSWIVIFKRLGVMATPAPDSSIIRVICASLDMLNTRVGALCKIEL